MRNILILALFIAFAGTSCVTQRKCLKRFPPVPEIVIKDSIVYKDKIVIRDTTVFVRLPGDTINAEVQIPVTRILPPVTVETKYAKATASMYMDRIKLLLIQKDAEIEVQISKAIREATFWRERYEKDKQKIIVEKKFIPKYVKYLAYFGAVCLIFIIAYIFFRIFKR